jgi:hypothetical protein
MNRHKRRWLHRHGRDGRRSPMDIDAVCDRAKGSKYSSSIATIGPDLQLATTFKGGAGHPCASNQRHGGDAGFAVLVRCPEPPRGNLSWFAPGWRRLLSPPTPSDSKSRRDSGGRWLSERLGASAV